MRIFWWRQEVGTGDTSTFAAFARAIRWESVFVLPVPKYPYTRVLGYKCKSGAVPQTVLVYFLFWVSPDFFPPAKKATKRGLYSYLFGQNTNYFMGVARLMVPPESWYFFGVNTIGL